MTVKCEALTTLKAQREQQMAAMQVSPVAMATPAPQPPTRCFHRLLSGDAIAALRPPTSPARALAPQAPTHATILGLIQFSDHPQQPRDRDPAVFQDQRMANSGVGLGG